VPMVIEMWQTAGVGRLISGDTHARERMHIEMFPSLERACTPELVGGGSFRYFEEIAIAIHKVWCSQQGPCEEPPPQWRDLDESRKESSRAQARDIPVKLALIGCDIAPGKDPGFEFTADEIELLAREEHKRWVRERIEDGWQPAQGKDAKAKKTPYLVPFDDLSADIADFDLNTIRSIPAVLTQTGQRVVRVTTTDRSTAPPARR